MPAGKNGDCAITVKNHFTSGWHHGRCRVRRPSDLGYSDDGYILPPLTVTPEWLEYTYTPDDRLGVHRLYRHQGFLAFLRKTIELRCNAAAERVNADNDQWIVWTYLEDEAHWRTA
jgi:hypothetical protein